MKASAMQALPVGRVQGHGLDGREQIRTPHDINDRAFADELVAVYCAVVGAA
jgi:hypothetical protein